MLFATGQRRCFCPVRGSSRLHWNFGGARLEAEAWAEEMGAGQLDWATLEGGIAAGRIQRARPRAAQHPAAGGAAAGLLLSRCLERKSTIEMRI
jgi:hypothetical protein